MFVDTKISGLSEAMLTSRMSHFLFEQSNVLTWKIWPANEKDCTLMPAKLNPILSCPKQYFCRNKTVLFVQIQSLKFSASLWLEKYFFLIYIILRTTVFYRTKMSLDWSKLVWIVWTYVVQKAKFSTENSWACLNQFGKLFWTVWT